MIYTIHFSFRAFTLEKAITPQSIYLPTISFDNSTFSLSQNQLLKRIEKKKKSFPHFEQKSIANNQVEGKRNERKERQYHQ